MRLPVEGAPPPVVTRPSAEFAGPAASLSARPLAALVGFRAAIASACFAMLFLVGAAVSGVLYSDRDWRGIEHWIATYSVWAMALPVVPSLLLTWAFVVLMASIHVLAPVDKKVLSLVGLSFALLYATTLNVNYFVQLTFVRQNVLAGNGGAVALLAMENPQSLFWAIEFLGYGLQCLGALIIAPLFGGWTRVFLLLTGAAGVLSLATPMLDLPFAAVVLGGVAWQVGLPAAVCLLAQHFRAQAGTVTAAVAGG
jgi:hypothetical protein